MSAVDTEPAKGKLRRLNLTMFFPLLFVGGVIVVASDARTWWHAAVLSAGVLAAMVAFVRWAAGEVLRVAIPCLVVAAAVWPFSVLVPGGSSSFFGVFLVGSLVVPQLPGTGSRRPSRSSRTSRRWVR